MTAAEEIAAGISEMEEAGALLWNGTGYAASVGVRRRQVVPGNDGELEVVDTLRVFARAAVFGAQTPRPRERVFVDGRPYRVDGVHALRGGGVVAFDLVHSS